MPNNQFPKTLAALQALEDNHSRDQWYVGDKIVEECGAPSKDGANSNILAVCAAEMRANGLDYTDYILHKFQVVAHRYPTARRRPGLSWSVHAAVPSPDMLDAVFEGLPKEETLTKDKAEAMVETMRAEELQRLETQRLADLKEAEAALAAAKKREQAALKAIRSANSEAARQKARKEAVDADREVRKLSEKISLLRIPNKPASVVVPVPAVDRVPGIALSSKIQNDVGKTLGLADKTLKLVEARGDELSQTNVDACVETCLQAHQAWLNIANLLQRNRRQRGHLAVVG